MKIDENGVCYEIDESDVVNGTLVIPEGVKKIDWGSVLNYNEYVQENYPEEFKKTIKLMEVAKIARVVILPKFLIEICDEGFRNFSNLEEIRLPDSVTTIGKECFFNCYKLKHITLSRSLTTIGEHCFWNCTSLEALIIPDSVSELVGSTIDIFYNNNCLNYLYLGNGIKKMGLTAKDFHVKELVLPRDMSSLNNTKFLDYCRELADKTVLPERLNKEVIEWFNYNIGNEFVFRTQKGMKGIQKKEEYDRGYDTENLRKNEESCENNPVGRKKLEMGHISERDKLPPAVYIDDNTDIIGECAFAECENLEEVIIGKNVKSIERGAFAFCKNLRRVVLPQGLQVIGNDAFRGCTSLAQIDIVSDVDRIGNRAFYGCSSLRLVDFQGKVGSIGEEAFVGCENLEVVTKPELLRKIGDYAFKDCRKLISIPITKGVETIGKSAFENCCSSEQQMFLPRVMSAEKDDEAKEKEPDFFMGNLSSKKYQLTQDENGVIWKSITVPGFDVIVSIPSETKKIGKSAFAGCKNLLYVHMDEKCELASIEEGTFEGCERLEEIDIPKKVQTIGTQAFSDCKSLTNISLPKGFQSIGHKAFKNCENLRLVLTDGNVKREADSFDNTDVLEGNVDDLNLKVKRVDNVLYSVVGVPEEPKKLSFGSIKSAIKSFKNRNDQR